MKKLLIILTVIFFLLVVVKIFNDENDLNSSLISYYVETGEGTGVYEKQDGESWPDGYILNKDKSACENGGLLEWDSINKKVIAKLQKADNCKIYLNKEILPSLIVEGQSDFSSIKINEKDITVGEKIVYNVGDVVSFATNESARYDSKVTIYDDTNAILYEVDAFCCYCSPYKYTLTGKEAKMVLYYGTDPSGPVCP